MEKVVRLALWGALIFLLIPACAQERPAAPSPRTVLSPTDWARSPASPTEGARSTAEAPPPGKEQAPPRVGQTGKFWVAAEDERRVLLVDLSARGVVRSVPVPGRPHNLAVARDGTVAVALQRAGRIALVREGSVETVDLGGSPHDVKPVGGIIVVANEGAARLDLVATDGTRRGSVSLRANPHDVAATPDGRTLWASLDGTDEIVEVDLPGKMVTRYLPTGKRPHDLIFTPDGRGWVTDWGGSVHVFSREGQLERTLALGREAHHLSVTPDGLEVWITDHAARAVFVVDAKDFEIKARLPVGGPPHHVAISRDGKWAAVADHDRGLLVIFEVASRKKVDEIRAGAGLHGVWAG